MKSDRESFVLPSGVLDNHIAVLGKTGSGKTSTSKLIIEHVVAQGHRVCVLDTVKSDWWGLTSSRDGKKAGLDFKILGGPRGHVPLHSNAGKVIGQLVGSGKLRHSIIDMADFEAGGIQKFFVDFAPALMRNMKGVLYLVIEEAHEVAPKERAGFGEENMAIHFAKKLATAGRSKGIRLIVATQSVQQLHNRVLGSAETLIAHRLTAPADQEPVIKWLKANTVKDTALKIAGEMSSVPTGTGWVCSGEITFFEKVKFPKFSTYDNTSTPTGDMADRAITTTPVDQDELRAIIGDAVTEAEANDPVKLRREIAKLKQQLDAKPKATIVTPPAPQRVEVQVVKDHDRTLIQHALDKCDGVISLVRPLLEATEQAFKALTGIEANLRTIAATPQRVTQPCIGHPNLPAIRLKSSINAHRREQLEGENDGDVKLQSMDLKILAVLSQFPDDGCKAGKLALLSGYSYSGGFRNALARLRSANLITGNNTAVMRITQDGMNRGPFDPLPEGDDLKTFWLNHSSFQSMDREVLAWLLEHKTAENGQVLAEAVGKQYSGGFRNSLARLRTAGVIKGRNSGPIEVCDELNFF